MIVDRCSRLPSLIGLASSHRLRRSPRNRKPLRIDLIVLHRPAQPLEEEVGAPGPRPYTLSGVGMRPLPIIPLFNIIYIMRSCMVRMNGGRSYFWPWAAFHSSSLIIGHQQASPSVSALAMRLRTSSFLSALENESTPIEFINCSDDGLSLCSSLGKYHCLLKHGTRNINGSADVVDSGSEVGFHQSPLEPLDGLSVTDHHATTGAHDLVCTPKRPINSRSPCFVTRKTRLSRSF